MGRPISWPDLDGLSARDRKRAMDDYTAGTEAKPIAANFERAGLSAVSISTPSIYRQLEDEIDNRDYSNGSVALRADDLRLLVPDRPNAPINADIVGGGSHSRPMRTKIVRSLSDDCQLIDVCDERHDIAVMVACDVIASPNNAPTRRQVLHSAGQTVQRHVISQSVKGDALPMRQVANASDASYQTIDVASLSALSLGDGSSDEVVILTESGQTVVGEIQHGRPLVLSDLRLDFGIVTNRDRSLFARQLEAALHCLEMVNAIENLIDSGKLSII